MCDEEHGILSEAELRLRYELLHLPSPYVDVEPPGLSKPALAVELALPPVCAHASVHGTCCSECVGKCVASLFTIPPILRRSPALSPPSSQKYCIYLNVISSRCELEQIWSSCFASKCPLGTPSADTLQSIMMTF